MTRQCTAFWAGIAIRGWNSLPDCLAWWSGKADQTATHFTLTRGARRAEYGSADHLELRLLRAIRLLSGLFAQRAKEQNRASFCRDYPTAGRQLTIRQSLNGLREGPNSARMPGSAITGIQYVKVSRHSGNRPDSPLCKSGRALLAGAAMAVSLCTSPSLAQNGSFEVELDDDKRISLNAQNASLREILLDLEQKTGVKMNFVADPVARVSMTIESQSFEQVINKLAPDHLLVRGKEDGKSVIRELIIISNDPSLSSGQTDLSNLPSGEPAPEVQELNPTPPQQPQPASPEPQPANPQVPENQPAQPPTPSN